MQPIPALELSTSGTPNPNTQQGDMPILVPKEENLVPVLREQHKRASEELISKLKSSTNGRKHCFEGFNQIISEKNVIGSLESAIETGPSTILPLKACFVPIPAYLSLRF